MLQRIFFSQKTAGIAFVFAVIMIIASVTLGTVTGELKMYDYFMSVILLLLAIFLYYEYRINNIYGMQAGCCGMIVCSLLYQVSYVSVTLLSLGANYYILSGFWGSIYLAGEIMILILEAIFAFNYYFIFLIAKPNLMRTLLNTSMVLIIGAFLAFQILVAYLLNGGGLPLLYFAAFNASSLASLVLVACTEMVISIDAGIGEQ